MNSKPFNFKISDNSGACSAYRSYIKGNNLSVDEELVMMLCSSVMYFMIILILESSMLQVIKDKVYMFWYKIINRNNVYNVSTDEMDSGNISRSPNGMKNTFLVCISYLCFPFFVFINFLT